MSGRLVIALAALGLAPGAVAADPAQAVAACRGISASAARLACYDAIAGAAPIAEFAGSGSAVTAGFETEGPSLLRFESRDAIMVAYLLDASGAVVQNLHHGGAGEGSYEIARAGLYRVQVNASGGWRIRVERR